MVTLAARLGDASTHDATQDCGKSWLLTSDNPAILDRLVLEWAPWDQEVGGEVEPWLCPAYELPSRQAVAGMRAESRLGLKSLGFK